MSTRVCSKCGVEKELSSTYFHAEKRNRDGFRAQCKDCFNGWYNREYRPQNRQEILCKNREKYRLNPLPYILNSKEYRVTHNEEIAKRQKENIKNNPEKYAAQRLARYWKNPELSAEKMREYRKKHPEIMKVIYLKDYNKQRSNVTNRVNDSVRATIRKILKGEKAGRSWERLVGYSISQLKKHLEKKFLPGMTWENYGRNGWHIDHKIPISAFNFEKTEDIDFKKCWGLKNLQPLWEKENISKHDKIDKSFQPSLAMGGI